MKNSDQSKIYEHTSAICYFCRAHLHKEKFTPDSPIEYDPDLEQNVLHIERDSMDGWFLLAANKDGQLPGTVTIAIPDGTYTNQIDQQPVAVKEGKVSADALPLLLDRTEIQKAVR